MLNSQLYQRNFFTITANNTSDKIGETNLNHPPLIATSSYEEEQEQDFCIKSMGSLDNTLK